MTIETEDPRKTGLKNGLRQLNKHQLQRILDYPAEMVLDTYNYHNGKFCPLAVALNLHRLIDSPTNDKVTEVLTLLGFTIYNTRGIKGTFYTNNRKEDLLIAIREVLEERLS
jgi:hypothetical protein